MNSAPKIAIIIPVYGNWDDVAECLDRLQCQSTPAFEILISDDGSPTPPPLEIQNSTAIRYIHGERAGYGMNCNRAAKEAIRLGATHLLLLNSDVVFGTRFVERWTEQIVATPDAILGPLIYWSRNPGRIWTSGGKLTVFTPFIRARRAFSKLTTVETVTGCALLVPVTAWNSLGGFNPKYFMYFEDFDLTLRAKAQGISTYVAPDSDLSVFHHVSGSFRKGRIWEKHYLMLTSSLIFIRSHYRGARKAVCLCLCCGHLIVSAARSLPETPRLGLLWRSFQRGLTA